MVSMVNAILEMCLSERSWKRAKVAEHFDSTHTKYIRLPAAELFIEPDSNDKEYALIQFGNGHIRIKKEELLKQVFLYLYPKTIQG